MGEGNIPVELSAEEWNRYLPLQQKATDIFVKMCAEEWIELKEENAPLRAVINGRLMGVAETLYDRYIELEITKAPQEFYEARVIGDVMGKYRQKCGKRNADCILGYRSGQRSV